MRIAVMGSGSTGGYFGGMLARAGNDVSLIARGAHLEAIQSRGLRVVRDNEEFTVDCPATNDPSSVGVVDVALLTVKTYQNDVAIPAMTPLIGPETAILCLQNGVDSYQTAAGFFGPDRVLPGAAYIEAGLPRSGHGTPVGKRGQNRIRRGGRQPIGPRAADTRNVGRGRHSGGIHRRRPRRSVEQIPIHRDHGGCNVAGPADPGGVDATAGMARRGPGLPQGNRRSGPRLRS